MASTDNSDLENGKNFMKTDIRKLRELWPLDILLGAELHDALCGEDNCEFEYIYEMGVKRGQENSKYAGMAMRILLYCKGSKLQTLREILQEVAAKRTARKERVKV